VLLKRSKTVKKLNYRILFCGFTFILFFTLYNEQPVSKFIKIGTTLDLTRGLKSESTKVLCGLEYVFNKVNKEGGINGRKIKLTPMDDEYTPDKARENIEILLNKVKTGLIVCPAGTPTLNAYLDLVKEGKVLVLFPITGTSIFRKPDLRNLIHLRASYYDEGYVLTKYVIEKLNAKNIAFFYQNDASGLDILRGARDALKEKGIKDGLEVPYERNDVDFSAAVKKIKGANIDAIGFFSTSTAAEALIRQLGLEEVKRKKLFGISDLSISDFKNFIKDRQLHFIIAHVVPCPEKRAANKKKELAIIKQFQDDVEKSEGRLLLDCQCLEAYLAASLFVKVLKQIKGDITFNKIIEKFEAMKEYNFGGLPLNFDPETRQLLHNLWLDTGKEEWIKVETNKKVIEEKKQVTPKKKPPKKPKVEAEETPKVEVKEIPSDEGKVSPEDKVSPEVTIPTTGEFI